MAVILPATVGMGGEENSAAYTGEKDSTWLMWLAFFFLCLITVVPWVYVLVKYWRISCPIFLAVIIAVVVYYDIMPYLSRQVKLSHPY